MVFDISGNRFEAPKFDQRLIVIVGGYGSGKSEVSVNLGVHLARSQDEPVAVADLDIVNPYFRSREAAEKLEAMGVRAINPSGGQQHSDLPIILPEIRGVVMRQDGYVILDVGGDDVGARVLSSLADAFVPGSYEMLLVLNANRPFTSDLDSTRKVIGEIEVASSLKFTGIISNTHLLEATDAETVYAGLKLAREVGVACEIPVCLVSALSEVAGQLEADKIGLPLLPLNRELLKPWERKAANDN